MANDTRLQGDLIALVENRPKPGQTLPAPAKTSSIGAAQKKTAIGAGAATAQAAATDAGISSPLTETAYADRQWYDVTTITSTDGAMTIRVRRLKSMKMKDAKLRLIEFKFSNAP